MKIIFSERCLEYRLPRHPESPRRLRDSYNFLRQKANWDFLEPKLCSQEDLASVHTKEMIDRVKEGLFLDPDTPNISGVFDYARLSVGAAIEAGNLALNKEKAFSLMRPPGHHATRESIGGFCYFNNIAIAVKRLLSVVKKIAILDIDAHHGNGTQDIFLGDRKILYVSLHQSPLYPGTGLLSKGNCLNFPLAKGTGAEEYLKVLRGALEEIERFRPELMAISCGFDAYGDDPLTGLNLEKEAFKEIAQLISNLKQPSFAVLEGGYSQDLPECIYQFLTGWK